MQLKRARGLAGASAAALLAGCALGEHVAKPDLSVPAAFEAPQAKSAADVSALDQWWTLFGDPQLTGLVEEALASSPDAKTALYRLQEARAQRNLAIASVLPTGDFKGSATEAYSRQSYAHVNSLLPPQYTQFLSAQSGVADTFAGSFNPSWELDLYGGDAVAIKTANAGLAASRFAYEASRFSLAAQVATNLFQARGLAVQLANARENLKLARDLAEVSRRKREAGLSSTADEARTLADAESAEAQAAALEAQLKGAERALLVLVGRGAAPLSSLTITADVAPPPPVPATTPGSVLVRRPDVRQAEANLAEALGELRLDKLAVFPRLTLQPGVSINQQALSLYTVTTKAASGGVGVTVPVLGLPKLLFQVRAQGAVARQAASAYEKAVKSAYGDAERALTSVEADGRRVKLLQDAAERSRFAFDAANTGYKQGLTDLTSLVQAEQSWRQTLSTYTLAEVDALVDTVAAFKALGGGWPSAGETKTR